MADQTVELQATVTGIMAGRGFRLEEPWRDQPRWVLDLPGGDDLTVYAINDPDHRSLAIADPHAPLWWATRCRPMGAGAAIRNTLDPTTLDEALRVAFELEPITDTEIEAEERTA